MVQMHPIEQRFQTKRDAVIDALRDAVYRGEILPGQRLFQDVIAKEMGVSTTPVREAIQQLVAEGLLIYEAHRKVTVASISKVDVKEIYSVRASLEALAVEEAMNYITEGDVVRLRENLRKMEGFAQQNNDEAMKKVTMYNDQFHILLMQFSRMERLLNIVNGLRKSMPFDFFLLVPGRADKTVEEHRQILHAIEHRQTEEVIRLIKNHIISASDSLIHYIEKKVQ
jgi:DNA-binding GntR family transcriptional regulator